MMLLRVTAYSIAAAIITIACITSQQMALSQTIENDQYYIGDDEALHIVGEIVNDLNVPLSSVVVHAIIYDEDKNVILEKEANSLVNTIMPGMRGPFDLILANANIPKEIAQQKNSIQYSLDLDYDFASPKKQVIDITESQMSRDRHENLVITGMVANRGEITANMISVVATIYDDAGNVAAVTRIHTEPDYLRVDESTFFVVPIPDKKHTANAVAYDLTAESEEYAAVPEFPIGTTILLIGTFLAYVIITRLVKLPMTNLISAASAK